MTAISGMRARMMAAIRGRDTKPELQVRRGLHALGYRFRLNQHGLPGTPDIVMRKWGVVIMVHGCFWHGHRGCRFFRIPYTRTDFWTEKIHGTIERDLRVHDELLRTGWRVAQVWECALKRDEPAVIRQVDAFIQSPHRSTEIPATPWTPG